LRGVMFVRFQPKPTHLAMPDVCCDLVWVRQTLYLSGPATRGQPIRWPGESVQLLNIDPLVARKWLGVPLRHLVDRQVPLREIDPVRSAALEDLFHADAADTLVTRPCMGGAPSPRVALAASALRKGHSLEQAASTVGLSARQLERLFADQLGLS